MTDLFDFIKRHEGLRLEPYMDTEGNWTVFYGRNISEVPCGTGELRFLIKHGSNLSTADYFLRNDITQSTNDCYNTFSGFALFTDDRRIALKSVMFNLGLTKFLKFKRMRAAIRDGDWSLAHDELLDSKRARQLPKRSNEEALMLKNG